MLDVGCWLTTLREAHPSTNIQDPTSNIRSSFVLQLLDVRHVNGTLPLGDSTLDLLGRIRLGVPLHHHHVLDHDFSSAAIDFDHAPLLTLVAAGNGFHHVILLHPYLHRLGSCFPPARPFR